MSLEVQYEEQRLAVPEGVFVSGRIRKAARLFSRHLACRPVERFLDIGCGEGKMAVYLASTIGSREVYGVDIAPSYAEDARGMGVHAEQVDVDHEALPFPDGHFTAIFCGEVIEHLVDPDHLLDEIHRVLAPQGVCVITTPNLAGWHNRIALLLGFQPFPEDVTIRYPNAGKLLFRSREGVGLHLRLFTHRALKEVLRRHNFVVLQATGIRFSDHFELDKLPGRWRAPYPIVRPLDILMSRFPSLSPYSVVAVKNR